MKRKHFILLLSSLAALAFWFLGVDRSWFVEKCPTCGYRRDILQYRIFTVPISEHCIEEATLLQKVAADLGAECIHPKLGRYHKHRYWGLCACAFPCINGIDDINADISWYDDIARAEMRALVQEDPSIRRDFAERVMKNRDREYWGALLDRVKALREKVR